MQKLRDIQNNIVWTAPEDNIRFDVANGVYVFTHNDVTPPTAIPNQSSANVFESIGDAIVTL